MTDHTKELVERLLPYTSHAIGCAIYQRSWATGAPDCSCGLDAVRAEALSLPRPTVDREAIVEAAVEAWHGRDAALHEWLGWSWEEYAEWVATGKIPRLPKAFAGLIHPIDNGREA